MDLRANNENNKNVDSELGALEKFESEVKNTIFGILFVVLKEYEISIYLYFVLSFVEFVQLLIFPFHDTINDVWNSDKIVNVIHDIVNYVNIVPWVGETTWGLYVTLFYVGVFLVGVFLILSVYASYVFSRKKASFTWPITTLRYTFTLTLSILYLPVLDYFVSMIACVNDPNTGKNVHSYFTEVVCWSSTHVIHGAISIVMIIIFVILFCVSTLVYYEYKDVSTDPSCRINSRQFFLCQVYKTIMVICLTFLTGSEFQVLLLALILIGSIILFVKYYLAYPFHNETTSKVWSILMAVNLWTAAMLVFAKIMENTLFEGSIIAWLLGIPFVILIILTNRDPRIELLLINVNKFQSPQEVQDQIRYLLKMIEWQANKKNSAILLDGYIEIHKQSCNQEDCPLKQKNIKTSRFSKNLMSQDETVNEKYAVMIQLMYKMYTQAIKKFPNSTSLRIAYAFFLLEKMQSKQQALQELSQAEQNKPPFDEQFVIFRYKKLIEDEIAESQAEGQGGLDVVSEIAFQNHLRQLQANIEKSALLHMEFWSQLSEDNPDLAKLNDIGSKINSSVHNVEEHWNKLLKINASNAKAVRLYGKYLIEIINDKEAGDNLLEKARNLSNTQANKRGIQMIGANGDDYSNEATPIVWVSGEQDKFGQITGINLTAASLFGYNKTELLNRKVNVLMPQLYAKHHDSFLDTYMNSGEGSLVGKNKERLVFGKNKSNYIFPVYYGLRVVQSIIQGTQFIATFRVEKNFKNAAYILTQPDGTIDSISSSAISLLKVDLKIINQKKGNIQDLIPNIVRDKDSIFTSTNAGRSQATINYNYPKDSEYLLENDESFAKLHCYLYELIFLEGRENAGYQFRFERIIHKSGATVDKNAKISNFQFRFEKNRASVIGEYAEGSTNTDYNSNTQEDEVLEGIQHSDQESDHERDLMNSAKKSQPEEQEEVQEKRVDYGIGIKTLRLVGGRPQEIEDDKGEDDSDEEGGEFSSSKESKEVSQSKQHQQLVQQEEEAQEEGSYKDFSTTFKSRKALTMVINDKSLPPAIRTLRYVINILGVIFLAIAITDYAIAAHEFSKINTQIDLVDKSNSRLSQMMGALSNIRDLTLINIGLLNDISIYSEATLRASLQTALDTAQDLKQDLEQVTWSLSSAHLALLNDASITLVSQNSGTQTSQTTGLTQAMEQILSRGNAIVSTNITSLTATNSDVWFMTNNLLNGFYAGLKQSSQYYAQELTDRVNDEGNTFLILMIASIVALVLAMIVLFPILRQVNKTREEVLSLFLDIPEKTVKGLYTKCETFISNLQVGEDEDMISEIDDEELEKPQGDHDTQDFIPRRRRKKFKNSGKSQNDFFIKFMIVVIVLEGYFIFAYVSTALLLNDISTLIPEYNATSVAEPFFSFANNAERELFINNSDVTVLGQSSATVATNNIVSMYDLDSLILEDHSINRKIHTDDYANTFNQIMMSTPCGYLTNYVTNATCVAFADQTVFQGMTVALSRHFENLRTLLSCATKIIGGSSSSCTITPTTSKNVDTDATKNLTMNLMRTTQAQEITTMQFVYIRPTFQVLVDDFKQSLKDTFSNELTVRLAVFIVFIVVLVIVYIFLWQTLVRSMSNEIWRTKSMLNMIPLSVIAKIKSIRLYLKRFWNDMNIAEQ